MGTERNDRIEQRRSPVPLAIFGGRGGGAQAAFAAQRLEAQGLMRCVGFLNDNEPAGTLISGYPVLGPFVSWPDLAKETRFLAPLHKAKQMMARADAIRELNVPLDRWANVIDPQAVVAPDVSLGTGVFASAGSSIMCGSRIGHHVAVRPGGHIGHDALVEDFAFVGANAVVCGYAKVMEGAHIAPGALIREGTTVGRYSVVGLGAVVVDDVPDGTIVAGNPARIINTISL
jgi:sugar O-acyltransferase (sialic acid O-acetyltransferase NeuD family)